MRIIVDSNVTISAFLSPAGAPAQLFAHWQRQAFELVVSEPLLQEYQRALQYGRVASRHHMVPSEVAGVITEMRRFALVVEPQEDVDAIPEDPDDNRVLECAVAGAADCIVSGDVRHLLRLREYQGIHILSPTAFLALLDQQSGG